MSETLSQDEVSALLRGISDGDVAAGDAAPPAGAVRDYDLTGEERLVGARLQALDLAHERFVRRLRQSLAGFVGSPPNVEKGTLELLKFGIFRNRLSTPSSLHVFSMSPLRGQALAVVSQPLAYGLVDRVFGGSGRPPAAFTPREYSPIETQMLQRFATQAMADLAEAWASLQRITCTLLRSEMNPVSVAITGPAETVLVQSIQCDVGIGPAPLIIAVPATTLEPLRDKLGEPAAVPSGPEPAWLAAMTGAVHHAEVTLSAELGTLEISARELLRLRVGDMLTLPTRPDDPLALAVEGIRLMTAVPGVSRGNNAVRVLGRD